VYEKNLRSIVWDYWPFFVAGITLKIKIGVRM
jgi:hypothetical protein